VTYDKETVELIPLLVQGKLEPDTEEKVNKLIEKFPQLQAEYQFWQGVYSIRSDMARLDFSDHPSPEMLDRFAQGKINEFSAEYSQIASHLSDCQTCTSEVELLRQAAVLVPEDEPLTTETREGGLLRKLLDWFASPRKVFAVATPMVIVLLAVVIFQPWGGQDLVTMIELKPQLEERNFTSPAAVQEHQVELNSNTEKLIFSFVTDRLDIPEYSYSIYLSRCPGKPISLPQPEIECQQTELTNICQLSVIDSTILDMLKLGGSYKISIKEHFPKGTDLEPVNYAYYFKVSVDK